MLVALAHPAHVVIDRIVSVYTTLLGRIFSAMIGRNEPSSAPLFRYASDYTATTLDDAKHGSFHVGSVAVRATTFAEVLILSLAANVGNHRIQLTLPPS